MSARPKFAHVLVQAGLTLMRDWYRAVLLDGLTAPSSRCRSTTSPNPSGRPTTRTDPEYPTTRRIHDPRMVFDS